MKQVLLALTLLASLKALAYPENARHGYVNCTSCHVSPNGGGTLTPYGRSLSSELMSTWSRKNEEGVLEGLVKPDDMPEWLAVGGDLRAVQTLVTKPATTTATWIPMGENLELAVTDHKITVDSTFGKIESLNGERWGSNRYFIMYNITDEITARAGRFYPQFGLYIPDHYVPTKRGLGFDEGMERNSFEVAWNGENWSAFATASQTPLENPGPQRETGFSAQLNRNFGDSSKAGVSYWHGASDAFIRDVFGLSGIVGFSKKFFLLTEWDHQWLTDRTQGQRGLFIYNRLGYEVAKGLLALGQAEYGEPNMSQGSSAYDAYGPGLQWFPRPHLEALAFWEKRRERATGPDFYDYAFLMLHYYW